MSTTIPVLTFHRIDDGRAATCFSPKLFKYGMARLRGLGFQSISLTDAVRCLREDGQFPERSFVITFDDGDVSVYTAAFPILKQYEMPATVFLTVGDVRESDADDRLPSLDGCDMLSWEQIREMRDSGVAFGAHTLTHPDLIRLSIDRVEAEMRESKDKIEQALDISVSSFAYPYGRWDAVSRAIAARLFECACTDELELVRAASDPYALERIDMYYLRDNRLFALLQTSLFPWYIFTRRIPRQIRRAIHDRWSR